ncbi:MAG: methyltransferase domain-containing protein [Alphaproteobacteria bacterium]|nr:methyltransferase domain-containing protein [Alphaproteobacteria bacterium]
MAVPNCRFCNAPLRLSLVDLGAMPLANSYLTAEQLAKPEPCYPLHARVCQSCRLVQVDVAVPPREIFSDYAYFSSVAISWVEQARRFAAMARTRWNLSRGSKVIEVASNDGYLLRHFVEAEVPVLGVEPAANVAAVAVANGIPTEVAFFGRETAQRLRAAGHEADLIVGNNVLAHVPDINDFVAGLALLLKPDGVVSLEFPHLLNLLAGMQFDTIYHEHFSYLSLLAVERILAMHGLRVFDIEKLPTHGGSLRVLACRKEAQTFPEGAGLAKVRGDERMARLDDDDAYRGFAPKVAATRDALLAFLRRARGEAKTVAAYGAAAKGNTLLNYCGVGADLVGYVVDRSPHKQGRFLPGSHLPILAPEAIYARKPDYVLILPWNLQTEITAQLSGVRGWGGRFVIAIPSTVVLP